MRLCLRLPSGGKEALSMCANDTIEVNDVNIIIFFSCFHLTIITQENKFLLQNFIRRIEDMGYARADHTYLIPFPKTNVGALPSQTRLSDTILYPSNTVFITKV